MTREWCKEDPTQRTGRNCYSSPLTLRRQSENRVAIEVAVKRSLKSNCKIGITTFFRTHLIKICLKFAVGILTSFWPPISFIVIIQVYVINPQKERKGEKSDPFFKPLFMYLNTSLVSFQFLFFYIWPPNLKLNHLIAGHLLVFHRFRFLLQEEKGTNIQ